MAAPIFSAMVLTASSQLMRSHSPAPRSPTRFMGYLFAVGVIQRLNARGGPWGTLGPRTWGRQVAFELDDAAVLHVRMMPQFEMQARHDVCTSLTSSAAYAWSLSTRLFTVATPDPVQQRRRLRPMLS